MTAFPVDLAENRSAQNHHTKVFITASGGRTPDFGDARSKCTDLLGVNRSTTGRYTDVRKILAQKKTMLVVGLAIEATSFHKMVRLNE